ncbi:two-component system response regulator [Mucilaginibacter angelicae]|uniref:Two-component system response regulator n=1 Tax=Mucilaginibacter angelicae TaxID=869718 RepID=A0ABV6L374_9SPHI
MGKRILIFDDDGAVLDVLQVLLDYEGFDVEIIERTDDLLSLVQLYQPSLILIDFSLGGTNGGDWCTQLKKHPEFKAIPIIIFTAYSNKGIEKGTYGCDDFIAKPFSMDTLLSRINLLINRISETDLKNAKESNGYGHQHYSAL